MRPDVGAIVRDEDRHVAEELDAMLVAFGLQALPLAEELVLQEGMKFDARRELIPPPRHGYGVTPCDVGWPFGPRRTMMSLSQGHEERIIIKPFGLLLGEGSQLVALWLGGCALKGLEGFPQEALFEIADRIIVYPVRRKWRRIPEIMRGQQPLCLQRLQTQQQGIARKGRIGLVGGIPEPRGTQRQHLPHVLAAIL